MARNFEMDDIVVKQFFEFLFDSWLVYEVAVSGFFRIIKVCPGDLTTFKLQRKQLLQAVGRIYWRGTTT